MLIHGKKHLPHNCKPKATDTKIKLEENASTFVFLTPPFPGIRPHPRERASRAREGTFARPPLAEMDGGARPFAGDTEGWCEWEAWRGRAATGGPMAGVARLP